MKTLLLLACLNLDLITIADFSGSVGGHEETICQGINTIIQIEDEDLRQALIQFSSLSGIAFTFDQKKEFECYKSGGTTNLSGALELALEIYADNPRDANRVIILICDGEPDNKESALQIAKQLKLFGIKIYGVLINSNTNSEWFMKEISDVYVSTDYNHLVEEIKKLSFCL
jgi:uncharacterized sporulation protein YeaH/YhbH (DUF444 family)